MRDESKGGGRWFKMMLVSLLAASSALIVSNLSCGKVIAPACAQEACPDLAALEARVMELDQKLQPLLAIAELKCGAGNVLAWSGTAWECTGTINGDLTITGNATIGQELTASSGTVRFGTTPMSYSRASIGRTGNRIQYHEDGTLRQELDIGDGTQPVGGGASAFIQYRPGSASVAALLLFNIQGLRTVHCTLLHSEDDTVAFGLAFATDAGNGYLDAWGGVAKNTFLLSRQGVAAHVIEDNRTYSIACF